jgi:ATP-dependent protease ClpP protease subunit
MARLNRDDIDKFHDYGIYVPKRTLYIGSIDVDTEHGESGTDSAMAEAAIKNLSILEGMSSDPITIIMNNLGGDELHGLAIYDAIKACKSQVTIKIFGYSMSMGSIILQAADVRIMSPTSKQMIHYGSFSIDAHVKTAQKWAQDSVKSDEWMEKMYLEKIHQKIPDFSILKLKKMLDHDTILTARESINLGLADKILGEEDV